MLTHMITETHLQGNELGTLTLMLLSSIQLP